MFMLVFLLLFMLLFVLVMSAIIFIVIDRLFLSFFDVKDITFLI